MKRKTLWTVVGLVVVLIVVVVAVARANFRAGHGWCGHGGWHRGGPLSYVSHELKLNDTQISEVHAIWNEERPTIAGLLKEMVDGAHQMEDATSGGNSTKQKSMKLLRQKEILFPGCWLKKSILNCASIRAY